jgi:hypothetical protein
VEAKRSNLDPCNDGDRVLRACNKASAQNLHLSVTDCPLALRDKSRQLKARGLSSMAHIFLDHLANYDLNLKIATLRT